MRAFVLTVFWLWVVGSAVGIAALGILDYPRNRPPVGRGEDAFRTFIYILGSVAFGWILWGSP